MQPPRTSCNVHLPNQQTAPAGRRNPTSDVPDHTVDAPAPNRASKCLNLLSKKTAIKPTVTHKAAAYTRYQTTSWRALTRGGLNITSDPVELACMSCANGTLFVFEYIQPISARIAVMTAVKAKKIREQIPAVGRGCP